MTTYTGFVTEVKETSFIAQLCDVSTYEESETEISLDMLELEDQAKIRESVEFILQIPQTEGKRWNFLIAEHQLLSPKD